MSKDTNRLIEPLNWSEIVKETIRRRKEAGLNQKTHAALAGVSIPTMISFERAETTISMDKALAILEVVSMSVKLKEIDKLSNFADQANKRWFELTQELPSNSPGRHSHGYFACFFAIKGELKEVSIIALKAYLKEVAAIKYSGWSPFWIPTKKDIEPYLSDNNTIECWLGKKCFDQNDSIFTTYADNTDFWRASSEGYMYLQRGYQEDSSDTLEPGKIFDLILPIRTIGEIIHYAYRLASKLSIDDHASIDFHVKYTGLRGRELVNWSDPTNPFFDRNKICVQNTVESSVQFQLNDIYEPLPEQIGKLVNLLLKDLYSKFGFYELKHEFIVHHLEKLFSRRFA